MKEKIKASDLEGQYENLLASDGNGKRIFHAFKVLENGEQRTFFIVVSTKNNFYDEFESLELALDCYNNHM